jgi:hypothetical protein
LGESVTERMRGEGERTLGTRVREVVPWSLVIVRRTAAEVGESLPGAMMAGFPESGEPSGSFQE